MYVASVGNEVLMSMLVKHGANVKTKDNTGKTALDYAIYNQHIIISQLLKTILIE